MTTKLKCECLNDCGDDPRIKKGLVTPCKRYVEAEKIACSSCGLTVEQSQHLATRANTPDSAAQGAMGGDFTAKRLRRVANLVGLADAVPKEDALLLECAFSVLGMIAYKLEQPSDATAQPSNQETIADQINPAKASNAAMPDWMKKSAHFATAQPRVDLTDERAAFEIVRAALPKFSLVEGDWLIRAVKVGPYQDVEEAEAIHIDTINTIIRALLANTAQGKPEQDLHSDALDIYEKMASDPAFEMTCMDGTTNVVGAIKYALAAKKG